MESTAGESQWWRTTSGACRSPNEAQRDKKSGKSVGRVYSAEYFLRYNQLKKKRQLQRNCFLVVLAQRGATGAICWSCITSKSRPQSLRTAEDRPQKSLWSSWLGTATNYAKHLQLFDMFWLFWYVLTSDGNRQTGGALNSLGSSWTSAPWNTRSRDPCWNLSRTFWTILETLWGTRLKFHFYKRGQRECDRGHKDLVQQLQVASNKQVVRPWASRATEPSPPDLSLIYSKTFLRESVSDTAASSVCQLSLWLIISSVGPGRAPATNSCPGKPGRGGDRRPSAWKLVAVVGHLFRFVWSQPAPGSGRLRHVLAWEKDREGGQFDWLNPNSKPHLHIFTASQKAFHAVFVGSWKWETFCVSDCKN